MGGTALGEVDTGLGEVDTGLGEVDTGLELDSTGLERAVAGLAAGMEEAEEAGHLDLLGAKTCQITCSLVPRPHPLTVEEKQSGEQVEFLGLAHAFATL